MIVNKSINNELIIASKYNKIDKIKLILNTIEDNVINNQDENGNTALIWASINNNIEIAIILLNNKADCNIQDKNGCTALFNAVRFNYIEFIKLLHEFNADFNIQNKIGECVLFQAVVLNNLNILKILLSYDVNCNLKSNKGNNILMIAVIISLEKMVSHLLFLNICDINTQNKYGETALMLAATLPNNKILQLLLSNHADVNIVDKKGKTALLVATNQNNDYSMIQSLLDFGADCKATDYDNRNMIYNPRYHKYFIQFYANNADINTKDQFGCTPLMNIASSWVTKNDTQAFENFLGLDPDVNIQDNDGNTVFMNAVIRNYVLQLKLLDCCNNLNVNITNIKGDTALALANQFNQKRNLRLVEQIVNKHSK